MIVQPAPTYDNIYSASLYLERYGSSISSILDRFPVTGEYIADQVALPYLDMFMNYEGWDRAGSGYFSAVYVKGGLAIKVGLKTEDSGAVYAAWCRANQGRAGVPVIHAIDKFTKCYVVLMDRCYPVKDFPHSMPQGAIDRMDDILYDGQGPALTPLEDTLTDIRSFFLGIACFDISDGNVMLDRNLNMVITDPVSYGSASLDDVRSDDEGFSSYPMEMAD